MHICAHEIIVIALILNAIQGVGHLVLWDKVQEARKWARKFDRQLKNRPVRTIVYRGPR